MPNGEQPVLTDFQKQLAEWEKQYQATGLAGPQYQQQMQELEQRLVELAPKEARTLGKVAAGFYAPGMPTLVIPTPKEMRVSAELSRVQEQLAVLNTDFKRNLFYSDLYSIIPALIVSGAVNTADEALAAIAIPDVMTEEDIAQAKQNIARLLSSRDIVTAPPEVGLGEEPEGEPLYPPLVPPVGRREIAPVSIHSITTKELLKTLALPTVPVTTMTREEWVEYLALKGWSQEDIDNEVQIATEQLVAGAQNRKNLIESYLNEAPLLPERTMFDIFKMAVINPPLVVLEGLNIYYEHVSMPAAGWLYSKMIPDMKKAYDDFARANPEATDREAFVYAWRQWEAPGPVVLDFMLKYILMEGVVDPLTFVGWGIGTKFLRSLGPVGKQLAIANQLAAEVLELPFDFLKWTARAVPKTAAGKAAALSRESLSILDRYFELAVAPGKVQPLTWIKPRDMYKAAEDALAHLARNPRAEDDIAKAAREILIHPPVSRKEAVNWIQRLRRTGVQTVEPEELLDSTLLDVDILFERVFNKEISVDEATPLLMKKFGVLYPAEVTEEASVLAGRLLSDRGNAIHTRALDFTLEDSANKVMRAYGKKSLKIHEQIVRSEVLSATVKAGRVNSLLYNMQKSQLASWATWVDRFVVRSAAESYLTFGLYGPMNVIEDIFRSALGGVRPGRMTVERNDILTMGLLDDPSLRIAGISEKYGPLRDMGEAARTNWILTMSLLPLSLPTYAATRGKITPARFSRGAFEVLVERFGAIGMEMRRNFRGGKYLQLLADSGGDAFKALDNVVPKDLPSGLAAAPKWVKRNLKQDLHMAATTGKLTTDNDILIKTLKDRYTRDTIHRVEIDDIIQKYPDISPTTRSLVFEGRREFMASPEAIDDFMRNTVLNAEIDDFLRGPERAAVQYEQLTNLLTSLEVANPADVADLVVSLHRMTATYGAMPDQLMARATIKSRGLPIADRKLQFDAEFDRLYAFMDKAGASIDTVIEKTRVVGLEERIVPRRFSYLTDYIDSLGPEGRTAFGNIIDFVDQYSQLAVRGKDFPDSAVDRLFTNISKSNRESWNTATLDAVSVAVQTGTRTDKVIAIDIFAQQAHDRGSFLAFVLGDPQAAGGKFFAEDYLTDLGRVIKYILDDLQSGDVTRIKIPQSAATQRYLDVATTARKTISEAKTQDAAFRSSYFADATQRDLRDPHFWDSFYASEISHWKDTSKKMAFLNSQLSNAINDINVASGLKMPSRPAVVVRGRPLAPADVAQLMGTRGDDLSRMLLDNLIPEGDKQYFVEYVMGLVREGQDIGFDRASVGAVYDQIADSLLVDPASSSWFRSRQKQLESMTKDFHDLYNAKLFPDDQKRAVDGFIDDVARGTDDVMFEPVKPIRFDPALTEPQVRAVRSILDRFPANMTVNIDEVKIVRGLKGYGRYDPKTRTIELSPRATRQLSETIYHEVAHQFTDDLAVTGKGDLLVRYAEAIEHGHAMEVIKKARAAGTTPDMRVERVMSLHESFALDFERYMAKSPELSERASHFFAQEFPVRAAVPEVPRGRLKSEFQDYGSLRQSSLDEANKWYYKEYTDYTNANAIDDMMKKIYPFWTYESQRWFWLPRSFVRRPGTLAAWGRWENNTDYGYFHIPGTAIDVNPARGTVYGPWSTRLMRRDYPEYYDQLEGAGGMVGFFDFLSRYGFYPNIIYGAAVAQFGGAQPQTGGILPSIFSTPLNALIAQFPDNELVTFISERVFPEQFRLYLTSRRVDDFGGDGSLLFAKIKGGVELTPKEEALWAQARQSVAGHSALFEQFGMFRMRSDESYAVYKAAEAFIEENWGYTAEQQRQIRLRGEKLWDLIGGLDPWETAVIQELEFFKYSGSINPVLPSKQQEILNRIERDWADVMAYSESVNLEILDLQTDFLVGSERGRLSPDAFLGRVRELYGKRRDYIDEKTETNPLMLLENRTEYYEKYGQTMPVQSPYNELMDLFFSIELEDTIDPSTGERIYDWDKFHANRSMITDSIPEADRADWDTFLSRHTAPMMQVWREVYETYLRKYYQIWDQTLTSYSDEEQALITEYLFLERTGQQLDRQTTIKAMVSEKTNLLLISSFRSDVSKDRIALRHANPHLDAWLFYWGRTSTFASPQGEATYVLLAKRTGRSIE